MQESFDSCIFLLIFIEINPRLMKRCLILIILLTYAIEMAASWADNFRYAYYGINEGLCDEYVTSTYKDKTNFLWICTSNGLDRFDGNRFIHYSSHSEYEITRIPNDFVYNVTEDLHNQMWGVTNTGLFRINKDSGKITFPENFGAHSEVLSRQMNGITTDANGNLLILRPDGLTLVILDENGEIAGVTEAYSESYSIRFMSVQEDIVWIGGLSGIEGFNIGYDNSLKPVSLSQHAALKGIKSVSTLLAVGEYLWIGTESGLFCYDIQEKGIRSWKHEENQSNTLSDNHVTCLAVDKSGDMLIGTIKGIDRLSRDGSFQHIQPGRRGRSLNTEYINHILVDNDGTLWVGTLVGGINQISPKQVQFEDLLTVSEGSSNIISCIFEDKDGNLLMGILGKGLGIRRADSENIEIHSLKDSGISQEDIFVIRQDKDGNYWMASRNDGLLFLDKKDLYNPRFTTYDIQNSGINSNVIYDLDYDEKRHGIWFSTTKSLYFHDIETKAFTIIRMATDKGTPVRYHNILLDSKDCLWVGGYVLCKIDLSQNATVSDVYKTYFYPSLKDDNSNSYERITSVEEAPDGTVFIGSQNNGVYAISKDGSYSPIHVSNQVFKRRVTKLICDDSGALWIGTTDGIYHYSPESHLLRQFTRKDGIPSVNCYINSGYRLSNGRPAFGTADGMVIFDAPVNQSSTQERVVTIADILYKDNLDTRSSITHLNIYPSRPFFMINFSSLDLSNEDGIIYSYKLDEQDSNWNITNNGSVRYNNLKPGTYTFRVRCTNKDSSWSSKETVLRINVHPKFYQTFWFWGILFLIFSCFIMYIVHLKIKTQKMIESELSAQVEEKTSSLTKALQDIMESKESIERQNVLLEEQRDKLEDYSRRVEKANKEKLMMYTNLTHEFKTPLTLILGPVSELAASNIHPELEPVLQIIERNSKHLLSLVNQILDLRRVDAGQVKIKKEGFNIARLPDIYKLDYGTLLKERNITFQTRLHMTHKHIRSDRDIIHKILSNLVSNAVKHTPAGGSITLSMAQFVRKEDGQTMQYLSVTNSGSFISQSEYEKIFECFYKIENQPVHQTGLSSSGIGLYLVKQLVTDLGGEIRLKSLPGKETSFRVIFPVELIKSDPSKENITYSLPEDSDTPVLLLVEDNSDMRTYIRSLLSEQYHIAEASDGDEGFEMAKSIIPDFIISDLMMPGTDGLEFCRKIREENNLSHIPFLMLTALSNDSVRTDCYRAGVDAFLVKPFQKEMLLARIESILSNRHKQQDEVSFDLRNAYDKVDIKKKDKLFMENLVSIMKDNYSNPDFNVPQLQSQMCMSMTSFYKKVTALTGLTPALFIRLYRLQTAKKLLEEHAGDNDMNVSEIAYTVGFNDPKYFSKCFQNQYNILPSSILQGESR